MAHANLAPNQNFKSVKLLLTPSLAFPKMYKWRGFVGKSSEIWWQRQDYIIHALEMGATGRQVEVMEESTVTFAKMHRVNY